MKKIRLLSLLLTLNTFLPAVAQTPSEKPNLTIYDVNALNGWVMNDSAGFYVAVFNTGKVMAPASVMKVYASENEFREPMDVLIATINVPAIPADSFISIAHDFVVPITIPRYTSFLFAVVDADKAIAESDETDNEASGRTSIDQQASFGKLHVTSNTNGLGSWKVVGFPKTFKFNTIVEDVPKGPEKISFSPVAGYETPADTIVIILKGKTTLLDVQYRKITTSISENNIDFIRAAYPNPATDQFTVESSDREITAIRVFDMQGRESVLPTELNFGKAMLDVSGMRAGFYFIQILSGNTSSSIKLQKY